MHAEDLVVNECSNWHAVEDILEFLPNANAVSSLALVIESIHSVDLAALVIASQQEEVLLVLYLVGQQENNGLKGLLATVNIISQKQVVGLRRESTIFKQPQQVGELSMRISYSTSNQHGQYISKLELHCSVTSVK